MIAEPAGWRIVAARRDGIATAGCRLMVAIGKVMAVHAGIVELVTEPDGPRLLIHFQQRARIPEPDVLDGILVARDHRRREIGERRIRRPLSVRQVVGACRRCRISDARSRRRARSAGAAPSPSTRSGAESRRAAAPGRADGACRRRAQPSAREWLRRRPRSRQAARGQSPACSLTCCSNVAAAARPSARLQMIEATLAAAR